MGISKQQIIKYFDVLKDFNSQMMHFFQLLTVAFLLPGCNRSAETSAIQKRDVTAYHKEAAQFCRANGLNQDFYFLVDLAEHSGLNRFYVFDFAKNEVVDQGLVSHGICNVLTENPNPEEHVLTSNIPESHCSMLGKYRVGSRDYSKWGINIKYWLHGLEESNRTAVERVVVLHSWEALGDEEIYPHHAALSWGCPAVSNDFMTRLDALLLQQSKPTLLWIVN